MGPIIGSETEFGLVPREGGDIGRILRYFHYRVMSEADFKRISEMSRFVNWWKENLRYKGSRENKPEPGELELEQDVVRRLGMSGEYLVNGSRFYVDGGHLEYSTAECRNPWEVVAYERAGEKIVQSLFSGACRAMDLEADLLKRNTGYSGTSFACHENYLVSRRLFQKLTLRPRHSIFSFLSVPCFEQAVWVSHLISRQIFTGNGWINPNENWPECFKLSQRQQFIKYFAAHDTTLNRSIINLRDRPYADPKRFARLHVICGDSNRADWSNVLKYGTSCLVLAMLEDADFLGRFPGEKEKKYFFSIRPVDDFWSISKWRSRIKTASGTLTALDAQRNILNLVRLWNEKTALPDFSWAPRLMAMWEEILGMLEREDGRISERLDKFIKQKVIDRFIGAKGGEYKNSDLRALEYSYHVVGDNSLFDHLVKKGIVDVLVGDDLIENAISQPPPTRAKTRSDLLYQSELLVILRSWHTICFRCGEANKFITMPDPAREEYFVSDGDDYA